MTPDVQNLINSIRAGLKNDVPVILAYPSQFSDLRELLDDYDRLRQEEADRQAQRKAAAKKAGRKPIANPSKRTEATRRWRAKRKAEAAK